MVRSKYFRTPEVNQCSQQPQKKLNQETKDESQ